MFRAAFAVLTGFLPLLVAGTSLAAGVGGTLRLEVVDKQSKRPLACRMHLTNARGKALKAPKVPYWADHFTFDGKISLKLPKGEYEFVLEHGLEYRTQSGHFTMDNLSEDSQTIELQQFADLAAEGWWSGDVDVARPATDLGLLMRAEDLHVCELITWPDRQVLLPGDFKAQRPLVEFDGNRFYHLSAGIDARGGGTLLLFNLDEPLDLGGLGENFPPQQQIIDQAKQQPKAWIDAREAYGWDVPAWVASGKLDSVQVLNSNLRRKSVVKDERDGKKRPELAFAGDSGNGRWCEAIYYHLLNCGLRIPPTAGSGSGEFANPLGYNRMYVHVDGELTYDAWWEGVRAGRVMITNGPLLRPIVNGQVPGHVFEAEAGQRVELEIALNFASRDPVSTIEVIKNGEVEATVHIEEFIKEQGLLPPITFEESGWFLVRCTAQAPGTYRYAMTAPYYVEIGGKPRISQASTRFFLDWVNERARMLKPADAQERETLKQHHLQTVKFWQDLSARATAP